AGNLDKSLVSFFITLTQYVLDLFVILYCLNRLGLPLSGLVTALSAVSLAIGLALQDLIAGVANGLVIINTKPFAVDDFVQIGSITGTVKEISLLHTVLFSLDNKKIILTNKNVYNSDITNFSANKTRRVELVFSLDYSSDIGKVKSILLDLARSNPSTLAFPEPTCALTATAPSSLEFTLRFWTETPFAYDCGNEVREKAIYAFRDNGICLPYPQLTLSYRAKEGKDAE
ncbi:MAG: mechanosensitive ion channel family protein, partial [Sphaerochaetaceae bacterium]|nr:mechanosensitive ion channel family protein [Sphaerochaetaceae bacterium]